MKKIIILTLMILLALPIVFGNIAYPPNPNHIGPESNLFDGIVINFLIFLGIAFLITFLTELPVYIMFLRKQIPKKKILLSALLINITTHPLAFFMLSLVQLSKWGFFIGIETLVFTIEGLLLYWLFKKKLKIKKAMVCSFTANLITASMSFLLF